jgi:hypothetical protein
MHREEFGTWGRDLPEDSFWQAVAMVGVLNQTGELERGLRAPVLPVLPEFQTADGPRREWTAIWYMGDAIKDCREGRVAPAREFSEAWSSLPESLSILLYLAVVYDNQGEIVQWFSRIPRVTPCCGGLNPMPGSDWQWPMRFGFMTDTRSRELQNTVERQWELSAIVRDLQRTASVGEEHVFEWLIMPYTLDGALAVLEDSPVPIRAHCLLLTQPWNGKIEREQLETIWRLQELTTAKGIVQLQNHEFGVRNLVYQLSHNLPIETAFQRVTPTAMPLIFADLSLREMSRVQRYVEKLSGGLMRLNDTLDLGTEAAQGLNLSPGPNDAREIGRRLREAIYQGTTFVHERDGATWATKIQEAKPFIPPGYVAGPQDRIEWPNRMLEEGRGLQLNIRDEQNADVHNFHVHRTYVFEVWIGPTGQAMFSGAPFPEEALPQEEDGYLLTISFTANGFLEQPQLGMVFLPKQGESDRTVFQVTMRDAPDRFEGRLTIAYQNRILETYLLTGSVCDPFDDSGKPIELNLEMNVQQAWAGLPGQSRVGASLVLNAQHGEKTGMALSGYGNLAFSLEGLQEAIDLIESKIGAAAWDREEYKGLRAKGTTNLLVHLAKHGHELLEGIRPYAGADPAGQTVLKHLLEAPYIQILAAKESAKLPIEFFYSYESPDDDATICPEAEAAIKQGWCPKCAKGRAEYVCPSGFWALQKVIEWHPFDESTRRKDDFQSQSFVIEDKADVVRQMLWTMPPPVVVAASEKVDVVEAGSYSAMVQSIGVLGSLTLEATSWTDWVGKIQQTSPGVLVLVPHTDKTEFDEASLEVHGTPLRAGKINASYVVGPQSANGPVVLLLGCNTDNIDVPFRSFPAKFARAGAAIVVSTVSYVLGRHATRLASELVQEILNTRQAPGTTTFGELMLTLRRKWLLKDEPPISLSLKAYGDARWRL